MHIYYTDLTQAATKFIFWPLQSLGVARKLFDITSIQNVWFFDWVLLKKHKFAINLFIIGTVNHDFSS